MGVLAFDTATRATAVALLGQDGMVRTARDDPAPGLRPAHTTRLLALIAGLLDGGEGWSSVDQIAVGVGPGTFTGLRIGIATALALGRGRDLPVTGISTLSSLALTADPAADGFDAVLAVLDARRREVFAAAWRPGVLTAALAAGDRAAALPVLDPAAVAPAQLGAGSAALGRRLAVGDGALEYREVLEAAGIVVAATDSPLHRVQPGSHARLAAAGLGLRGDAVRPEYLRVPDAELTAQAAGR
ncbi:MAG TPA: tRNA (adenosine(37)-N6)-threonylcarbamoyltransferase complex dimerization subunit type 1 TsaB [Solirubrobacteraceae bacterium]|nr:tRNA (adenosine(37)-N6)-threonylcarbamoyltransferase complex dimerization subunit type 1 TsaB [Solirubrobacteraceae bacterium]